MRFFLEHESARQQPISDASYSINISPRVEALTESDFQSHEARSSGSAAWVRNHRLRGGVRTRFDDSKIEDFYEVILQPVSAYIEVGRLDIPVHKPVLVRFLERRTYLNQKMCGAICR